MLWQPGEDEQQVRQPVQVPRGLRVGALGVGLLSGGYGEDELVRASAYRVYEDPADLLKHIDEVGGRG